MKAGPSRVRQIESADKFTSSEKYNRHVKEHLGEIRDIYFEYLKNGHEIFDCSKCDFQSNDGENVKSHLAGHVINHKEALKTNKNLKRK